MGQFIPPPPVRILEDDGGLERIVEYANGARAYQYYNVESGEWLNEYDECGSLVTLESEDQ